MNTHNVNTAASESTKTWVAKINTTGLSAFLAEDMLFLASLCDREKRMLQAEREELVAGTFINIREKVCHSVTDWHTPKPKIPAAVVSAWLMSREMVLSSFGSEWEAFFDHEVKELKLELLSAVAIADAEGDMYA
ncbi:hypothetical protein [Candidatus Pantoea multigeneris]|uniref:Uncharacterized protein n=1 Tax=Candidatus Pantoea multigeneris TaxID=2608357 RepID=A0ABX0RJW5_9GAMM|nr:hypothetical protein [Pantoea multigeneris]NIF23904.1 hypothetical protein [Pantoea multigeneris]